MPTPFIQPGQWDGWVLSAAATYNDGKAARTF
jgi:hypothetical protein